MNRPLLLLDVDGVLNLTGLHGVVNPKVPGPDGTFGVPRRDFRVDITTHLAMRLHHRIDLRELFWQLAGDFEVIWATAWNDEANAYWAPVLGLDTELPHIPLDIESTMSWGNPRLCWKTAQVCSWLLANRPGAVGVWLDDEVSKHDRPYLPDGVIPVRCNPAMGLDMEVVEYVRQVMGMA